MADYGGLAEINAAFEASKSERLCHFPTFALPADPGDHGADQIQSVGAVSGER